MTCRARKQPDTADDFKTSSGQAKKEASDGRECKLPRRAGLERCLAELLVNRAVDLPFAIRMRISREFADNALNENMRALWQPMPSCDSPNAAMLAPSSSHHHRCVFPFHPAPTLKTTTPVPLSIHSPAKLMNSRWQFSPFLFLAFP